MEKIFVVAETIGGWLQTSQFTGTLSECESEDLDVNFWHELPKPPCH